MKSYKWVWVKDYRISATIFVNLHFFAAVLSKLLECQCAGGLINKSYLHKRWNNLINFQAATERKGQANTGNQRDPSTLITLDHWKLTNWRSKILLFIDDKDMMNNMLRQGFYRAELEIKFVFHFPPTKLISLNVSWTTTYYNSSEKGFIFFIFHKRETP